MVNSIQIKNSFLADRDKVFKNPAKIEEAFKFCVEYSLLVEEYIFKILEGSKFSFALASAEIGRAHV
jgi:hypothetical protein